ncbi:unnamed protein product [marine sediment metagenome]|uniref:Polymerase nucleotidyl transferase domain-containing protein n=1 Tax=marine sediment metagenome TaxID=412755 RepID=X1TWE6_9ZZZZ
MPELYWPDNFINRKANKIVKRFINLIIKKFNLKKIIIFGSFAREDYHKGSDLDLIIVGEFSYKISPLNFPLFMFVLPTIRPNMNIKTSFTP